MPALPVVLTRRAWRDVEAAAKWWEANRTGAPDAIRCDLNAALALIGEQPNCGIPIASRRYHGLRRIHLGRIGYHVYYRLAPRLHRLEVVAFWHARRGSPPPL